MRLVSNGSYQAYYRCTKNSSVKVLTVYINNLCYVERQEDLHVGLVDKQKKWC